MIILFFYIFLLTQNMQCCDLENNLLSVEIDIAINYIEDVKLSSYSISYGQITGYKTKKSYQISINMFGFTSKKELVVQNSLLSKILKNRLEINEETTNYQLQINVLESRHPQYLFNFFYWDKELPINTDKKSISIPKHEKNNAEMKSIASIIFISAITLGLICYYCVFPLIKKQK